MIPMWLKIGGIGFATYELFFADKKSSGKVSPQPAFTPGSTDAFTEMRPLPGGGSARYFKAAVAQSILSGLLAQKGVQPVSVQGQGQALGLWKLIDLQAGGISAHDIAVTANSTGLAVLASLSTVMVKDTSDKLLFTTQDAQKGVAQPVSQWAILLDGRGAPVASHVPAQPVVQPPGTQPNAHDPNVGDDSIPLPTDPGVLTGEDLGNQQVNQGSGSSSPGGPNLGNPNSAQAQQDDANQYMNG